MISLTDSLNERNDDKENLGLLCQEEVTEAQYQELFLYLKNFIRNINKDTEILSNYQLSLALVNFALRYYADGNFWGVLEKQIDESLGYKCQIIGKIFETTIQKRKFNLAKLPPNYSMRHEYVQNILFHCFVTKAYAVDFYDFLNEFYKDILRYNLDEDIRDDIELLRNFIVESNSNTDTIVAGNDKTHLKTYKLRQATKNCLKFLAVDKAEEIILEKLRYIDEYFYDDILPKRDDILAKAFQEWINNNVENKEHKKGNRQISIYGRRPSFELERQQLYMVIPEIKLRENTFDGALTLRVTDGQGKTIYNRNLSGIFLGFGIVGTEIIKIPIDDAFREYKIEVFNKERLIKNYIIEQADYRAFRLRYNCYCQTDLLYPGNNIVLLHPNIDKSDVLCVGNDIYCRTEYDGKFRANLLTINVVDTANIYIGKRLLSTEKICLGASFNPASKTYKMCDLNNTDIRTTRSHPMVTFIVDKQNVDSTLIFCNKEKFKVTIPETCIVGPNLDDDKILVSVNIDNLVCKNDGYYDIYVDEVGKKPVKICSYLLLQNLSFHFDKQRYYSGMDAEIQISGKYDITEINAKKQQTTAENTVFVYRVSYINDSAQFLLNFNDAAYQVNVPITVRKFGFTQELDTIEEKNAFWYEDIKEKGKFYVLMPGAKTASIYCAGLNIEESGLYEKGVFVFDFNKFAAKIQRAYEEDHELSRRELFIKLKYEDNKDRECMLFSLSPWPVSIWWSERQGVIIATTQMYTDQPIYVDVKDESDDIISSKIKIIGGENCFKNLANNTRYSFSLYVIQEGLFENKRNDVMPIHRQEINCISDLTGHKLFVDEVKYNSAKLDVGDKKYIVTDLQQMEENLFYGRMFYRRINNVGDRISTENKAMNVKVIFDKWPLDSKSCCVKINAFDRIESYLESLYLDTLTKSIISPIQQKINFGDTRFRELPNDNTVFNITIE